MPETLSPSPEVEAPHQAADPPAVAESTLTNRYQTTIPAPVRKLLGLEKQDKISYHVTSDGSVQLSRVVDDEDPVIEKFLAFLAKDMEENPQRIQPIPEDLLRRAQELVADVDIGDINEPLSDDDE